MSINTRILVGCGVVVNFIVLAAALADKISYFYFPAFQSLLLFRPDLRTTYWALQMLSPTPNMFVTCAYLRAFLMYPLIALIMAWQAKFSNFGV
ncbi:hypothetical protein L218DRAFT_504419 [Marasmius fiardii PR-910]|nr:hypothetical protein L218DRAFT_504419 [Marasmius fiardii PR-910]